MAAAVVQPSRGAEPRANERGRAGAIGGIAAARTLLVERYGSLCGVLTLGMSLKGVTDGACWTAAWPKPRGWRRLFQGGHGNLRLDLAARLR